ncbi:MAG TPA: hypothetical protein VK324_14090, partial [Tepidisphaeraceae bacterium]|nr:hypothetical protein [Tepidisphaeraceae bacterium]
TARGTAAGGRVGGLASMNSFALALLLGGLRGPLVMILWSSSETQKSEKNLEDFDTKVEWIRLLQPEFDTVHMFQVWNKAYNISVQMASLSNKYATILDALDYAESVNRERPSNINTISTIAQTYFDKLGNSGEKSYYKARVREETQDRGAGTQRRRGDARGRRTRMDPMLDAGGRILPEYRDDLKYLTPYEPFPHGLSPIAIAYDYFRVAQSLQNDGKQRHAQLSDRVVDSRPALTLKVWAEDEQERGRRAELAAFGRPAQGTAERMTLELPTADVSPTADAVDRAKLDEAVQAYARSAQVARDSIAEYEAHLRRYGTNLATYQSHLDLMMAVGQMSTADGAYLRAGVAPASERAALLEQAAAAYAASREQYARMILRYYIGDDIATAAFPAGVTREAVKDLPSDQVLPTLARATAAQMAAVAAGGGFDPYGEDRQEYETYIARATERLQRLGKR